MSFPVKSGKFCNQNLLSYQLSHRLTILEHQCLQEEIVNSEWSMNIEWTPLVLFLLEMQQDKGYIRGYS